MVGERVMEGLVETRFLVIGAGISGLSFVNWLAPALRDVIVCEGEEAIGGYCRTVVKDGFVWDYSGHFFHFKHPEIEQYLVERMQGQAILKVAKVSWIRHGDRYIDFPFQKNIHQLPQAELIDCLHDLYFRASGTPANFREMLYQKLGKGIAERFLVPYNEKL